MPDLPTGTVTFVFTDIEGSTRMLQHLGDADAAQVFADHRRLLRAAIAAGGGQELSDQGDGFLMVFADAKNAVVAAVAAQRVLADHPWPQDVNVRVRMGLHTGDPITTEDGYVGIDIHRAARISQVAWGGQIIVSHRTRELLEHALPEGMSLRDLGQHRLKDLQRPEQIFQILGPGLPADFPPLRSLDPKLTNLPTQYSSFIGREREMIQIKELFARARLVTLTGPGGTGKTRLAVQVTADLSDRFTDGLWLVDLSGVTDPAGVPRAAAAVLGVRELPNEPLAVTIAEGLGSRKVLLVVDNCEHVISACAGLTDSLLQTCPNLNVLATSREVLGLVGEVAFPVPSLGLPDLDRLPSADALTGYEAVQLFVDRARAAVPAFHVTERNAAALVQVCRRLDGIPLAIELAAARVKVLSVGEIVTRLDERFRLLTAGSRTAPPRHQTLQATMDWSYGLLPEPERALLRRLSVFAGGCTIEAVAGVCATDGVDAGEVVDLLTRLVDKSLVIANTEDGAARYRLLETVKEYGRERLREAGEETVIRRRHLEQYLTLAEQAEPELRGHQQSDWLDTLDREHDNLRAALDVSLIGDADTALRLAGTLLWFWDTRGHFSEGRDWFRRVLSVPGESTPRMRAHALIAAGHLAWHQSEYAQAEALIEEGLALFTEHDDAAGIANALWFLGLVLFERGDQARAVEIYERGLALYRELGDRRGVMEMLLWLGYAMIAQGDTARAEELFNAALALARELQVPRGIAIALRGLGDTAARQGDRARAKTLFEESLNTFRQIGAKVFYSGLLRRLGTVARFEGDYARAHALLKESLLCSKDLGEKLGIVSCLEDLAGVAQTSGQHERAVRLFSAASVLREALGGPTAFWEPTEHTHDLANGREALPPRVFATAWTEGAAMTLEQVMDYALTHDGR